MDLRQLATFRMVATTLSFTQAAHAMGYVQSSVTAQIQALEADLGVALFDRLGKWVMLTDAGERLLKYATQILALAEEARVVVAGGDQPVGWLNIGAPETLLTYRLPAVLQQYQRRFPHVRLLFHPSRWTELYRQVSDGTLDVAFILTENLQSNSVMVEPLIQEPLIIAAAPTHHLAHKTHICAQDLAEEQLILTELGCSYRNLFENTLLAAGVYPATTMEFNTIEAIKQCVIAGMGITVLPAVAVQQEIEAGRLVALPWEGRPLEVATLLVWHRDKWLSSALQSFLEVTREVLG